MFSKVNSAGLHGMKGYLVQVEADAGDGLPDFSMVGYLAAEVREAGDRVRTAIKNSGFRLPPKKVTMNLSPANVRKDGTMFDLPIALAVLGAYDIVNLTGMEHSAFLGELGLDGTVKPVRGVLPMAASLWEAGIRRCFVPEQNSAEGLAVEQMEIVKVQSLRHMVDFLDNPGRIMIEKRLVEMPEENFETCGVDFSEIGGQFLVRRATEVAVAGQHNILYIGPPGSGKSMIAQRIPTIMPSMSREERLEISKIYSICGMLPPGQALVRKRPFRSPHHTISPQAMAGGGRIPKPGEISLASRGVLFLDELAEFQKGALEILRQPLEEHRILVSRVHGIYEFPASFMLAVATNPCPCGYYPDKKRCSCNEQQVRRYLGKISRPLLDRIDICVEAAPVSYEDIRGKSENEASCDIRERIEQARAIQKKRFANTSLFFNGEMKQKELRQYCILEEEGEKLLKTMFGRLGLSARGCNRVLRVARTIADLDGEEKIMQKHLMEAISYRNLEERYWGRGTSVETWKNGNWEGGQPLELEGNRIGKRGWSDEPT